MNLDAAPLIGILGRNQRSHAFRQRLLLSGFPKPILCDKNSIEIDTNDNSNYVSHETFCKQSPSIILITDNLTNHFEDVFNPETHQLIIDARESIKSYFTSKTSHHLTPIPGAYRAFGNLSNWEIENGTHRAGVAVEQAAPSSLIKFISDLNCSTRGIYFLDQFTYNNEDVKSFRNCLFPLISTIIIFSLCFILSIIEEHYTHYSHKTLIYHQASSITAATSITLLSLLFLIRPILEFVNFIHSFILKRQHEGRLFSFRIIFSSCFHELERAISHLVFIQRWLRSRRYLAWYSLGFSLLHLLFILFSKIDFDQKLFYPVSVGIFTMILLCILSFVHFPWISERLLWQEYHLMTSYLGPFCLLMAFIHVFINWKYGYFYLSVKSLFNLKFLSMILPLFVLSIRFIIYGIIHPTIKMIQSNKNAQRKTGNSAATMTKDTQLLP